LARGGHLVIERQEVFRLTRFGENQMALKNVALFGALLVATSCSATEKNADAAWMSGYWCVARG
jgi:hypothetical protein